MRFKLAVKVFTPSVYGDILESDMDGGDCV